MFRRMVSLLLDVILVVGLAAIAGTFFGVRPYVVESGSMEPAIRTGSVCLINSRVPFGDVQVGDVVCFESAVGKKVIHRAVAITDAGIETRGDANANSDGVTTTIANYIGTVVFTAAGLGYAIYWIQTPRGMVICVAALLILFILAWEPAEKPRAARHRKRRDRSGKPTGNHMPGERDRSGRESRAKDRADADRPKNGGNNKRKKAQR